MSVEIPSQRHPWTTFRTVVGLLLLFVLAFANWRYPILRFTQPLLNTLFLLASFALPWVALPEAVSGFSGWRQFLSCITLLPFLAVTALLGLFLLVQVILILAARGHDVTFEPIVTIPLEGGRLRLYRTDCGATCLNGIKVWREHVLVPGLVLVRELGGFYPAGTATYEWLAPRTIRISVPVYRTGQPDTTWSQTYVLPTNMYF